MELSREIDASVANALGLDTSSLISIPVSCPDGIPGCPVLHTDLVWSTGIFLPHYSTSNTDALKALDEIIIKHPGWGYELSCYGPKRTHDCVIFDEHEMSVADKGRMCSTNAEAICRTILALAEVKM